MGDAERPRIESARRTGMEVIREAKKSLGYAEVPKFQLNPILYVTE
jgi:hypothetical protein